MNKLLILKIFYLLSYINVSLYANENYICYDKWPNASPPYHFAPNKCGPDSSLANLIPNKFGSVDLGEACNKHDRCWMELKDFNQYGRCELLLAKDLIKACNRAEICVDLGFSDKCVPNPVEIAACQSIVVPSYTGSTTGSIFFKRLKKVRDEQQKFEKCVAKYGYKKREK